MNFSNKLKLCTQKPARTQSPKTLAGTLETDTSDKLPTLHKIKRGVSRHTKPTLLHHIKFCPNAPKPTHHPQVDSVNFETTLLQTSNIKNVNLRTKYNLNKK
jgi:hypothetical protein